MPVVWEAHYVESQPLRFTNDPSTVTKCHGKCHGRLMEYSVYF